jgi:hypothetical protein
MVFIFQVWDWKCLVLWLVVERKEKGNKFFTNSSFPPLSNKNEHFKSAFNVIMNQNLTKRMLINLAKVDNAR